ncbi:MAG: hypothetical protein RLZZ126_381 [Pseudomonadota bacterium]|jgi:FdhD protein
MPPQTPPSDRLPILTAALAPLTHASTALNEFGDELAIAMPAERALTVYADKQELVTLMTLGAHPELLVLGYLRNQRLVGSVHDVESVSVDWGVGAAAARTRNGIADLQEKTARRTITSGCGQGSVFGDLMDDLERICLPQSPQPHFSQSTLYGVVNAIRLKESTYKSAGSVHACALFRGQELLQFVEDVGRHNAMDTIAGWMWMNRIEPALDLCFYTTGRLTSEMVIKSAQMGVPVVVSRSGITQMGLQVAEQLGMCTVGRATNKHFLCYSGRSRLHLQPQLASRTVRPVEAA